ncbi:nuclear fragile X mental retardation-interacting protein 2-like isoform X1 [Sinocyclocheilus anshuiensis]|uniref:nuclear fragile X mental retardation-interacting protein 2-like isoform X1 n=1 Tax=Sinocyclocheilus anshuiensis TaxID=1608454 RepID=UPI0007BA40BA|nr:PREDICTED: nuclear fragile X mental retardation-interacting protein 2-like isoform X1 [Sinocyclocheilus anshuiensis]
MEERPCEGATGVYISHGAENGPDRSNISVNNDQKHSQFQNEKTQTKKTENGKINGTLKAGEVTPTSFNPDSSLHPANSNGDRHLLDINLKQKPTRRAFTTDSTGDRKGRNTSRNSMDFKNDKSSELNTLEGKKEALATLNGVVSLNSVPLANGYPSKTGADNDGSGSESGYTTPKKRRAQRNGKAADNVTASVQGKAMQQGGKQDQGPVAPDSVSGSQVESGSAGSKAELHLKAKEPTASATPPPLPVAELQRKNSDSKVAGKRFEDRSSKVKVATSTKEDSWTLFKPPPVFPVDNSSAKIVPKISYASKVKENLNKTAQASGEALTPQVPGRPPQVPMSAVKTITSASFTNGPLPGPHFSASPLQVTPAVAAEIVASPPGSGTSAIGSSTTTSVAEPRKPSLFVYPITPSNMQLSLPSGRQADPPAAPTNQKSLGDIFQNQWGLSFINDPSAGPEGMACRSNGKEVPVEVSFQGGCPATVATQTSSTSQSPDQPPFPKAHEPEKRTNAQNLSRGVSGGATAASGAIPETSVLSLDAQRDETGIHGAIVFCSSYKDICAELPPTSPAAPKVASAQDQGHTKGFDRRSSWGSFDLKAAVIYHTKEMEYILNLQKQDPNRVVLYSESWDGPAQ